MLANVIRQWGWSAGIQTAVEGGPADSGVAVESLAALPRYTPYRPPHFASWATRWRAGCVENQVPCWHFVYARMESGSGYNSMPRRTRPKTRLHAYIREWRESKNLTQEQLAGRLGVTRAALSRWEGGQRRPDLDALQVICEALRISLEQLLHRPRR